MRIRLQPIRGLIVALCVAVLAGCGSSAAGDTVSDTVAVDPASGDVPIVSIDETMASTWTFGGLKDNPDDELNLRGIAGVVRLDGDRYFLAEGHRVRLFDEAGAELWRTGQQGAGPGDFDAISWPCRLGGDTVVAYDQVNRRIAYVEAGTGVIATVPAARTNLREAACASNGRYVTTRMEQDTIAGTGAVVVELRSTPTQEPVVIHREPSPQGLVIGHGSVSAGSLDTLVFVTNPDAGTITLLDQEGGFVRQLQWAVPRDPVTDENIPDRLGMVPAGASPQQLEEWWDGMRARPRVPNWPAFAQVHSDDDGRLWLLERFDQPEETRDYWVISATGEIVARVQMPRSSRERQVSLSGFVPGGVVLRHNDEDGAPHFSVIAYPAALAP